MRFRSLFAKGKNLSPRSRARRSGSAASDRPGSRRRVLEALEDRRLFAFDVLAEYATSYSTSAMELARIDADSRLDLILIENGLVTIRPGHADGSFGDPLEAVGEIFAERVLTGDFNNDGDADLATSVGSQISLRMGDGAGGFGTAQSLDLPWQLESAITGIGYYSQYLNSIAAGDINDDGKLDLVVGGTTSFPSGISCGYYSCGYTYTNNGYVNVLLGTGQGSFDYLDANPGDSDPTAHPLGSYQSAAALAIEDVNNDGEKDVVASKFYGGIATLLGDGAGALESAVHSGSGAGFSSISFGDLDGDGDLDTVSRSGNSLIFEKGLGDGRFVQGGVLHSGQKLDSAVIGDVNGDGDMDLTAVGAAACETYGYYGGCYDETHTRQASVLLGDGQGGFSLPIVSSLGVANTTYVLLIDAALADLTGDGLLELVTIDGGYQPAAIVAENDGVWIKPEELSIEDVTIVEGDSGSLDAIFTVTLSGEPGGPVSVDYTVFDYYGSGAAGAAQAGVDYSSPGGTLTFGPGVLSQTISVAVLGDRLGEGNESFYVRLSNPSGALLRDADAEGVIDDNEPTISIDHAYGVDPLTVVEGDSGTTPAVFTVTLSQPYDQEVTVDYYTLTGHTSDIVAASDTLRFAPWETSKEIVIEVVNDLIYESLEAFNVYLSNPSANASLGNGAGYCYIEDNDPPPTASINDVTKNEGNRGLTKFTFTVTLSAPVEWGYVEFATANGTATTANQDYTAQSGYLYFESGQTSATISVDVRGDRTKEADETFFVNLTGASGMVLADSQGVGTIRNDDKVKALRISDAHVVEGNRGTRWMLFTVRLSAPADDPVTVNYATRNGAARAGNRDYLATSGELRFDPGERSKTIAVEVRGDKRAEADEHFFVDLFDASGAVLADPRGRGVIVNDDA